MSEKPALRLEFSGKAKVGEVSALFKELNLDVEEMLTNPTAFYMSLTKLLNAITAKDFSQLTQKSYMASISFKDSNGKTITFNADLGDKMPLISKDEVKARIIIEIYDEEPKEA